MMRTRRFLQLDVFAEKPGLGNPLGVVLDAEDLNTEQMQALAAWLNLSETTFVLPSTQDSRYQVRIFTPKQELPFAGHPSVGTAYAVLNTGITKSLNGFLIQNCAAGELPVRVIDSANAITTSVRAPKAKILQTIDALPGELELIGAGLNPALINNGPSWWCVELSNETAVRELKPALQAIANFTQRTQAVGLAVFARSAHADYSVVVRAFCPADNIPEDPVTGSVNACIAAYLHQHQRVGNSYVASQGQEVGRDGRIQIEIDEHDEVWIGGHSQIVLRGELAW
jgi:PhzF family phenazine biosynthesis protein